MHAAKYNLFFLHLQDMVGFNIAGLQFMQRQLEARDVTFFTDTSEKLGEVRRKKKTAITKFK